MCLHMRHIGCTSTLQRNNKYWVGTKQLGEIVLRGGVAFITQSGKVIGFLAKVCLRTVWHAIMAIKPNGQEVITNGRYS